MTVRPDMANAFGICHGGCIFSLADSAFGYACNSYGDEMVAAGASIEFVYLGSGREAVKTIWLA
jgi:acyl-CoA thioesterase